MQLKSIFLLSLLSICLTAVYGQNKNLDAPIKEVLVYLEGAEITRSAKVSLSPGQNNFVIKGISGFANPQSIQLSGLGNGKISYVNMERDYLSDISVPADVQGLLEKHDETDFKLAIRKRVLNAYSEEKKLILSNQKILGEDSDLSVEDLVKLADLYRNRLKEIELKTLEISREIRDLEKELKKVSNQLGSWKTLPDQSQQALEIGLYSSSAASIDLEIKYLVYNARWEPTYDVIAGSNQSKIKLVYKAMVSQRTGVNWDNVQLNFSTGTPTVGAFLPELYPDYVEIIKNQPVTARAAYNKMELAADMEMVEEEGLYRKTSRAAGNVNTYFETSGKHSIASFSKGIAVGLSELDLNAEMEYLAVPKVSNEAYLAAMVGGFESEALLPGNARMYYEGTLSGSSYINPLATDEKLKLSLGRDPQIAVSRKSVLDRSKEGNLISSNRKSFHYQIQLKNNKGKAIQIKVLDQIPLSRNQEVEVITEDISGASLNKDTGELTWNINLGPSESKTLNLKYYIKFPKGEKINR
ncbi:DUF4139 domain-containing protein [Luteibaculum oceani]|uniref:Mucoidy inhibitor MuiA family protein n=1 Tax=Luteibaculum oceani TaxID=1294296 RepID=A0A5C6V7V1_9FLAO|nr:DUF4139 domain-containing protein [Luteibaculum oceani]TXC81342.1 mucoidy inhibitor MuiA family protein [Luteibaculum oceani]